MPKVSVIMPAHNAAAFIKGAIESVLSQDYDNLELIIVNDGSTDDLEKVLKDYMDDKRIRYIASANRGVSHAINTGLESANGDYICFLHADDIFLPGRIRKQVIALESHPECGISYTNESYFLEEASRVIESPYFHFGGDIFYFLKRNNFIHMSTAMFRRKIFDIARFDENLGCHEDWDIFLKLSARRIKFLYLDEVLASICVHPKSLTFNTKLMDDTRAEVGMRAKRLWKNFKKRINVYSWNGIANLARYLRFKIYAFVIGFPKLKKYNRGTPKSIFSSK